MTNKIKENIIIFWGGLAICLYIANSFEWIDINQWLQQAINYLKSSSLAFSWDNYPYHQLDVAEGRR